MIIEEGPHGFEAMVLAHVQALPVEGKKKDAINTHCKRRYFL
jgi:hypothetical protein